MIDEPELCEFIILPQVLIIDWILEIRHMWEPTHSSIVQTKIPVFLEVIFLLI